MNEILKKLIKFLTKNIKLVVILNIYFLTTLIILMAIFNININERAFKILLLIISFMSTIILFKGAFNILSHNSHEKFKNIQQQIRYEKLNNIHQQINYNNLIQEVKSHIKNEAIESYIHELDEKLIFHKNLISSNEYSKNTIERIQTEIGSQNNKANFNLTIGLVAAIIGGFVLFYFLWVVPELYDSQVIFYFIPRLTVVLLIEAISFFFLRLYKLGLNEIKYFQNELTSIEHRLQALNIALILNDKDVIKTILLSFSNFEKNSIVPKEMTKDSNLSLKHFVQMSNIMKEMK